MKKNRNDAIGRRAPFVANEKTIYRLTHNQSSVIFVAFHNREYHRNSAHSVTVSNSKYIFGF